MFLIHKKADIEISRMWSGLTVGCRWPWECHCMLGGEGLLGHLAAGVDFSGGI